MASLRHRRCTCGQFYDVLEHGGQVVSIDRDDNAPVCPRCGSDIYDKMIGVAQGIELGDVGGAGKTYPYFDRALGILVESKAHRARLCKERGLVPVDGDIDLDTQAREEQEWADGVRARNREYHDKLDNAPEFRDYRVLNGKGYYADKAKAERQRTRRS